MKKIFSLFFILVLSFTFIIISYEVNLKASDLYTDVLDDLRQDDDFDINNYPTVLFNDYINNNNDLDITNDIQYMSVISVAESDNDELFIYVYKPLINEYDLKALKISLSEEKRVGYEANGLHLFELELLSSYGVFEKYKVLDFQVSDESERYYNIVAIYREYSLNLDDEIDDTITNAISENVGQQYVFYYLNDKYICEMQTFETLDINVKLTDYITFYDGFSLNNLLGNYSEGRLFYIVFDLEDYIAKRIIDADLTFNHRVVSKEYSITGNVNYGDWVEEYITLYDTDTASYTPDGILTDTITWNRISSASNFKSNFEKQDIVFTDDVINILNNSQWVFAFYESKNTLSTTGGSSSGTSKLNYEEVEDIAILRIHFLNNDGKFYNLGVVGDITSPDDQSGGSSGINFDFDNLQEMIEKLLAIVLVILLFIVLGTLTPLLKVFINIIKYIFKFIIYIITLPLKLFGIGKNKKP